MAGATFGPRALGADFFDHGLGHRPHLAQCVQHMLRGQFLFGVKSVIERADDGLLDFRAAEILPASTSWRRSKFSDRGRAGQVNPNISPRSSSLGRST